MAVRPLPRALGGRGALRNDTSNSNNDNNNDDTNDDSNTSTNDNNETYIYIYICICIYIYICTDDDSAQQKYIRVYVCVCIYIYIHVYEAVEHFAAFVQPQADLRVEAGNLEAFLIHYIICYNMI